MRTDEDTVAGSRHRHPAPVPALSPSPALLLDRYRLLEELGAGSYGTVWLALDEHLGREVAVKVVPRERVGAGRFAREARAAARLSHPGIVTLYEATIHGRHAILVSELVRGDSLATLLRERRLSDRDVLRCGIALCDALAHAHLHGVVHRDVKPANILVPEQPADPSSTAKLTDFGVARLLGSETLTLTGDVIGTAAYMAPEQAAGEDAGPPADLFSLALVLYEGLTGFNPLPVRGSARGRPLPPLRRHRRDLPRDLARAIERALHPRPAERGTPAELRWALAAFVPAAADQLHRSPPPESPEEPLPASSLDLDLEPEPPSPSAAAWPVARPLSAAAGGLLTAWLTAQVLPRGPLGPLVAAAVAILLLSWLPRLGWFALLLLSAIGLAANAAYGAALVVVLALALPPLLLPARPRAWPLMALAPALGWIGAAGAWPALAGRLRGPLSRAALGACGWLWLVLAGVWRGGSGLGLPIPAGLMARQEWGPSLHLTMSAVLRPLASSGLLFGAPVWALAALVLPWLVRGRSVALDGLLAAVWALATLQAAGACVAAAGRLRWAVGSPGVVLGAIAATVLAVAPAVWNRRRHARRAGARSLRGTPGRTRPLP